MRKYYVSASGPAASVIKDIEMPWSTPRACMSPAVCWSLFSLLSQLGAAPPDCPQQLRPQFCFEIFSRSQVIEPPLVVTSKDKYRDRNTALLHLHFSLCLAGLLLERFL